MTPGKSKFRHFDFLLLSLIIGTAFYGIVVLWGSVAPIPSLKYMVVKQAIWLGVGLLGFIIVLNLDYKKIEGLSWFLYALNLAILLYLLMKGRMIKGAASWLRLGPVGIQPSEFMKLTLTLVLAQHFGSKAGRPMGLIDLMPMAIVVLVPTILIALQPDLGTAAILPLIFLVMCLLAGVKRRIIILVLALGLLTGGSAYPFLKQYQKERIKVFLNPWKDSLHKGYNTIQAEIALGSGQLWGKGWQQGTQTALRFLPEHHTDFIFCSLGEQFGLLGAMGLLMLYLLIIYRSLRLISGVREYSPALFASGLLGIFIIHIVLNLAMSMGMLPVVGLPLPFFSYGGSFLLSNFLIFGFIMNIAIRRFMF